MRVLRGVKALDLSRWLPGPYCTMLLGDLGAEVIKIEHPEGGDPARNAFPGMYFAINRNKKSVCVDLKNDKGKRIIYELTKQSDIIVEGFRPGVVDSLKIGYRELRRINPEIIYASISGFGQSGPYKLRPGHDITYLSLAGAMSVPARLDHQSERSGIPVADLSSSMFAVIAILAALVHRSETGKGQYLDISISDVVLSLVSSRFGDYLLLGEDTADKDWEHIIASNDVFDSADGKIAIAAVEQHFWEGLCEAIERNDLLEDNRFRTHEDRRKPENGRIIKHAIAQELLKKSRNEWMTIFDQYGVPASPVNSAVEALSNEHFIQRNMVKDVFVPYLGHTLKQIAFPVMMSQASTNKISPPPSLGEHTIEVLKDLGYSPEEIKNLKNNKIIA